MQKLVAYSAAAAAAGAATGAALAALGGTVDIVVRLGLATALAVAAVVLGLVELRGRRIRPLQCDRETPQRWMHDGPIRWALKNGAALGFGAGTRLGFSLWYVVPLGAFLFGNVLLGAAIYGAYGATRAISAWLMIHVSRDRSFDDEVSVWLFAHAATARTVAAAQLLALGTATVVGVGI